jgi:hypothetical protein
MSHDCPGSPRNHPFVAVELCVVPICVVGPDVEVVVVAVVVAGVAVVVEVEGAVSEHPEVLQQQIR